MKVGNTVKVKIQSHFTKLKRGDWYYRGYDEDNNEYRYRCTKSRASNFRAKVQDMEAPYMLRAKIDSIIDTKDNYDYADYRISYPKAYKEEE